jgi:hypothetical protein
MFVACECCVLSGRGLCDEPIHRPVFFKHIISGESLVRHGHDYTPQQRTNICTCFF